MKNLLLFVSIIFLISFASLPANATTFTGKVVRVLDGDTFDILKNNNKTQRVRLAEVDSPEKAGQPYGQKAKQYAIDQVALKIVTVEVKTTDRYGRIIGEVFLPDGKSINRLLVAEGYAWWYQKYSDDISLRDLEASARLERKGLWRDKNPIPPWKWRKGRRN